MQTGAGRSGPGRSAPEPGTPWGGDGPRLRPVGARAVLVEVADATAARSLALWARAAGVEAEEIVPAARSVLFDGVAAEALAARLAAWEPAPRTTAGGTVEIGVRFDGPDLAFVSDHWGRAAEDVLTRAELVSEFCGFAPGFAYLGGLRDLAAVPRLESPRPAVAAGAVAVADEWCGIYPSASPGGWRVVGHTDAPLWEPGRDDPALLAPGTRVRLVAQ